eukprot:gnl/TRDRNA2_/TRDRNA2_192919_c0_seq1.p1 gnl/TRDRNA2_/TRDRNA2_192919_c0~~gnl/TRDRNA2_/TRDRNA2_192919_c0_seq1.p1  ORF type:complete len:452 (+),score=78.25 gnl/TRDRNA2_/TRDRNA2_192919_c0_seq1:86-1441(+)
MWASCRLHSLYMGMPPTLLVQLLLLELLHLVGGEPLLDIMYLKYGQQAIDTVPVFNPMVSEYKATLDWKMKYFAVEAKPVLPAMIDNIHLCPQNADCMKQDQPVVTMDFSKNILVQPGEKVLYMFDVLLQGVVKSYTLIVYRLEGSETTLRHLIIQGTTIYPKFRPEEHSYRCYLSVQDELMRAELHVLDGGQTIFSSAEEPTPLEETNNITQLHNTHPANTRAPPTLRRLRAEAFGEFQYPNKYADFPVPLWNTRVVNFKVTSADGGHIGFYRLEVARAGCSKTAPLYDGETRSCVPFCNLGFYPDDEAHRCKRCDESCVNCLSLYKCIQCRKTDRQNIYVLDNSTGTCHAVPRPLWEQHPEQVGALALGAFCSLFFLFGLCAFRRAAESSGSSAVYPPGVAKAIASQPNAPGAYGRADRDQEEARLLKGSSRPYNGGYAPIINEEYDTY